MTPSLTIPLLPAPPALDAAWEAAPWAGLPAGTLDFVVSRSSEHHPRVRFRLAADPGGLSVRFRVEDRYVRSVVTDCNGPVCTDSCVEFFWQPTPAGYFNMEVNAGGVALLSYIEDPTIVPGQGFAKWTSVAAEIVARVPVVTTLPRVIDPEMPDPVTWEAGWRLPFALLAPYAGPITATPGTAWRGNLYKCADHTSHPHWLCWAPIEGWSFHQPRFFGEMVVG